MKSTPTSHPSLGTLELPFQSSAFLDSWQDFKTWRKEVRKPLTPTAEKRMLKKIATWKEADVLASIDQSITRNWLDLFEVKASLNGNGHAAPEGVKYSVEKPPCPDWRDKLKALTGKTYADWMEWPDVNWDERKRLSK